MILIFYKLKKAKKTQISFDASLKKLKTHGVTEISNLTNPAHRQNKSTVSVSFYQCSVNEFASSVLRSEKPRLKTSIGRKNDTFLLLFRVPTHPPTVTHIFLNLIEAIICGVGGVSFDTGRSILQTTYKGNDIFSFPHFSKTYFI